MTQPEPPPSYAGYPPPTGPGAACPARATGAAQPQATPNRGKSPANNLFVVANICVIAYLH